LVLLSQIGHCLCLLQTRILSIAHTRLAVTPDDIP